MDCNMDARMPPLQKCLSCVTSHLLAFSIFTIVIVIVYRRITPGGWQHGRSCGTATWPVIYIKYKFWLWYHASSPYGSETGLSTHVMSLVHHNLCRTSDLQYTTSCAQYNPSCAYTTCPSYTMTSTAQWSWPYTYHSLRQHPSPSAVRRHDIYDAVHQEICDYHMQFRTLHKYLDKCYVQC